MAIVFVNIGSNLGDKKILINEAIEKIGSRFGFYCISGLVDSEPWGYESTNRFLNIGVSFKTEESPEIILKSLQEIERSISDLSHRDDSGRYCDRKIDIDIMAIDELEYKSDVLVLPHPHLHERYFFLKPLMELSSDWRHPVLGKSIPEMLRNI